MDPPCIGPPSVSGARLRSSIGREGPGLRVGGSWTLECTGGAWVGRDREIAEAGSEEQA